MATARLPKDSARPAELLSRAVEAVQKRVEADQALAPSAARPLFEQLSRKHSLIDPEVTGSGLLTGLSNPPAVAAAFEEFTGQTIREYLDDRHLDVAERLLVDTDLQIEDVAVQAGFRDSRRLRAALRRRYDVLPTDLRQLGELPEAGPPTAEPFRLTAAARFERRFAESFWRQLGQRPLAELRHSLLHAVTLQTPALFHALGEASRIEGRRDRGRGVEIAELALAFLDANAEAVGEAGGELAALGWARLGRARRLALDFAGAEAAFDAATDAWAKLAGKGSLGILVGALEEALARVETAATGVVQE